MIFIAVRQIGPTEFLPDFFFKMRTSQRLGLQGRRRRHFPVMRRTAAELLLEQPREIEGVTEVEPLADIGDADAVFPEKFGGETEFPVTDELSRRHFVFPAHHPVNGGGGEAGAFPDPAENVVIFEMTVDFADDQLQLRGFRFSGGAPQKLQLIDQKRNEIAKQLLRALPFVA